MGTRISRARCGATGARYRPSCGVAKSPVIAARKSDVGNRLCTQDLQHPQTHRKGVANMAVKQSIVQAPFVLIPQYFGSNVFDRSTTTYLPFDHETTDLLISSISKPFFYLLDEIGDAEKREQAYTFFRHFYDAGFFTIEGRFAGELLDVQPAPD